MAKQRVAWAAVTCAATLLLSGCASFGEGVGRAVFSRLQDEPEFDRRACEIRGAPFDGILAALKSQDGQGPIGAAQTSERALVKLIFVHGIGSHNPGHSGRTVANLTGALGLNVVSPQTKAIDLTDPDFPGEALGRFTAQRFTDDAQERELIVYELTWSSVSDPARDRLQFDSSEEHIRHRAPWNQAGKAFINEALVDPLVYVGVGRGRILSAVRQGICWANSTDWDEFPQTSLHCQSNDPDFRSRFLLDRLFFVTHSLGSRIVLDALETTAEDLYAQIGPDGERPLFLTDLQNQTITLFMLANQLPLLQAGFPPVPVTGQIAAYCMPDGPLHGRRIVAGTRVIAFNDPNDLLSYPIPDDFVQNGIDSRLCPTVVNVSLNIAHVTGLAGRDRFADPMAAHSRYNDDERVIGLMTGGLGGPDMPPVVIDRCNWVRVEEALR